MEHITNTDPAQMSQSSAITPAFLDRILTLLVPLFLAATGADMGVARETVRSTLADYRARNYNEVRLAALVVAFGFGALEALGNAADRALSLDQVMDLRDNATALSQAGDRAQAVLDALRRRRLAERAVDSGLDCLPVSTGADELLALVRSLPAAPVVGSQRRVGKNAGQQQDFQRRSSAPGSGRTVLH
jgi:hypothetical protein